MEVGAQVRRITGVLLADGRAAEVTIGAGAVVSVGPPSGPPPVPAQGDLHLPGWLLLSAAAEPHAHLDKALSWAHTDQRYGGLETAIGSWRSYAATMSGDDVARRARRALGQYLANGVTAVRTHADVLPGPEPLRGIEALLRLREEVRDVLDLQVVVLPAPATADPLVAAALRMGADGVGGCPHLAVDPAAETGRLLDLAERFGVPADLHTDEQLRADMVSVRELCRQVRARAMRQQVTASHCVSLGCLDPGPLAKAVGEIRLAGLGIVSLPITNLYLQGRGRPGPVPRGITALRALLDAGVEVAAGGDNLRDPFNPAGRADPFETTSLLVTAGHLDAGTALVAVTSAARRVMGLPPAGPAAGSAASFVAVPVPSLADAVAGPGDERIVIHRGRLVSRTTVDRRTALPPPPDSAASPAHPPSALAGSSA
ncbi:MAG TPA: amidohydrolase family protein [Streptosporangiaceae bacterium]|jgi:cytosine deaminase|nr:amidohydrolase family protein [Streptosporangiaceae bacterium]